MNEAFVYQAHITVKAFPDHLLLASVASYLTNQQESVGIGWKRTQWKLLWNLDGCLRTLALLIRAVRTIHYYACFNFSETQLPSQLRLPWAVLYPGNNTQMIVWITSIYQMKLWNWERIIVNKIMHIGLTIYLIWFLETRFLNVRGAMNIPVTFHLLSSITTCSQ